MNARQVSAFPRRFARHQKVRISIAEPMSFLRPLNGREGSIDGESTTASGYYHVRVENPDRPFNDPMRWDLYLMHWTNIFPLDLVELF